MTDKQILKIKTIGKKGENLAEEFFTARGYKVLGRHIHTPDGELDLIVQNEHDLIFVEVKTRTNLSFGYGETAITERKSEHFMDSAEHFLFENEILDEKWRIDVLAILLDNEGEISNVEWFENAV